MPHPRKILVVADGATREDDHVDRVRLAELCAATSLFTDLGTGQPSEHGLRSCSVAMRLADAVDVDDDVRREVFYVSLLRFLGCTAEAHEIAGSAGGDDLGFLSGMAPATMGSPREEISRLLGLVGRGERIPRRLMRIATAMSDPGTKARLLGAHCEVAERLATEMGMPTGVAESLSVAYARWDGRGVPSGVADEAIPVSMRVAIVARDVELWGRDTDAATTADVLRGRRGRAYAPDVVDAALAVGVDELRRVGDDLWESVLASEPVPWREAVGPQIDAALGALGDFADLKSPDFAGHARRTANIARAAAARLGDHDSDMLLRAALIHDLGVVAVPAGVWRTPRRLSPAEWEQVRLHPMWTERILARCPDLRPVAVAAGRHHERLDGSGYPAGVDGAGTDRVAGLLACADLFDERMSPRPYRPTEDAATASDHLARLAEAGVLATADVEVVLDVTGSTGRPILINRPSGLTEREVDVLRLLARGGTLRQIAGSLGISAKTVGAHVEHIYAKAGVHSRAAATLFAVHHDLLD
jgi:HD-GYP domain-containing protein (c-di-GMP phosphodiesterase class II)/DNA-binding CsgD family transcriptional regulator